MHASLRKWGRVEGLKDQREQKQNGVLKTEKPPTCLQLWSSSLVLLFSFFVTDAKDVVSFGLYSIEERELRSRSS